MQAQKTNTSMISQKRTSESLCVIHTITFAPIKMPQTLCFEPAFTLIILETLINWWIECFFSSFLPPQNARSSNMRDLHKTMKLSLWLTYIKHTKKLLMYVDMCFTKTTYHTLAYLHTHTHKHTKSQKKTYVNTYNETFIVNVTHVIIFIQSYNKTFIVFWLFDHKQHQTHTNTQKQRKHVRSSKAMVQLTRYIFLAQVLKCNAELYFHLIYWRLLVPRLSPWHFKQ